MQFIETVEQRYQKTIHIDSLLEEKFSVETGIEDMDKCLDISGVISDGTCIVPLSYIFCGLTNDGKTLVFQKNRKMTNYYADITITYTKVS